MLRSSVLRFYILTFSFILLSCTKTELPEAGLYEFLKDQSNDLVHKKTIEPFGVSLMYKPSELLASQEITTQSSQLQIDSIEAKYEQYIYFVLNYTYREGDLLMAFRGNQGKYAGLVNQLSFGLRDKVSIITDKSKTIKLADAVFSRHYGLGAGSQVLLAFNRKEIFQQSTENFKVKIKDIGIGIGQVSFEINKEDIENCPKLNR